MQDKVHLVSTRRVSELAALRVEAMLREMVHSNNLHSFFLDNDNRTIIKLEFYCSSLIFYFIQLTLLLFIHLLTLLNILPTQFMGKIGQHHHEP